VIRIRGKYRRRMCGSDKVRNKEDPVARGVISLKPFKPPGNH